MRSTRTTLTLVAPALICLLMSPAHAERVRIPLGVFPFVSASSVHGPEAAWSNPAALAYYKVSGYMVMADYFDGKFAKSWGTVVHNDGFALAYRNIDNAISDYKEYVFAGGIPLGHSLAFGLSYRYFKEGPDYYDNRHLWNLGILTSGKGKFRFGAMFSNLNRGRINGSRTDVEHQYSASYRALNKIITLSLDAFSPEAFDFADAEYVYSGEVMPRDGLYLRGWVNSDRSFGIGLRANLLRFLIGSESRFDRNGNGLGTTVYGGAVDSRQPSVMKEKARRLSVSMGKAPQENPSQYIFGKRRPTLIDLIMTIYRAADDPSVAELLLKTKNLSLGFGQVQELRKALLDFRSHGKRVVCHLSRPNNLGYYLATAADRILIPPVSQLNLIGLKAELSFYAGTLDKLGVKADIVQIGDYKTAPEMFIRRSATDANREQINRLMDNLFAQFVSGIAEGRQLSPDSVARIIDGGPYTSEEAAHYGLVDGLSYTDDLDDAFHQRMPEISFKRYLSDTLVNDGWPPAPKLAIVTAEGEIRSSSDDPFAGYGGKKLTPRSMKRAFEQALLNPEVKGVIFRINSPGGLAMPGEEIYRSASRTADKKPMTVSMGNVAASGGYYVAMASQALFANPGAITGSIGIFGGKVDLSGLYEKIDLGKELFLRGKYAGMLSSTRPFTDDERTKYRSQIEAFYNRFINLVAQNRNLSVDSVDALSGGRVWTGREAAANGLVDHSGGLIDAIRFTADRLKIDEYRLVVYPQKRRWFKLPGVKLLGLLASALSGGEAAEQLATEVDDALTQNGIFARMPYDLTIE